MAKTKTKEAEPASEPTSADRKRASSERNAKDAAAAAKVWRQERAAEDAERAAYHASVTSR